MGGERFAAVIEARTLCTRDLINEKGDKDVKLHSSPSVTPKRSFRV